MNNFTPESILKKIKEQGVTQTPHWRYVVRLTASTTAIVFVTLGLFYLGSLVGFLWQQSHYDVLPGFGPAGFSVIALRFPWWHVLVILFGLGLLYFLLRRFTAGYRLPVIVLGAGLIVVLIGASFAIRQTPFHDRLWRQAESEHLPILGPLYRGAQNRLMADVVVGTITATKKSSFTLQAQDEETTITVTFDSSTQVPPHWGPTIGDRVAVLSAHDAKKVKALAIHPLPPLQQMMFKFPAEPPFVLHMN